MFKKRRRRFSEHALPPFIEKIQKIREMVIMDSMSLTQDEVNHIADLACLELTQAERARYREQLSAILDYAARLQSVDTSHIPPTSTVLAKRTILRPDAARPGLTIEDALRNAPDDHDDQFRVPPVME